MKKIKLLLITLLSCLAAALPLSAQELKIAVVDMDKVFNEYHRTPVIEKMLSEQAGAIRAAIKNKTDELQNLEQQLLKLQDEANNIALSQEVRNRKTVEFKDLYKKLQEAKLDLEQYAQTKSAEYRKIETEKRTEIIKAISAEVEARAIAGNYTLVLDKSGKTINGISSIIYHKSSIDITKEVIRQLNRTK